MLELCVLSPDDWRLWRDLRLAALAEAPYAFGSRLSDWSGAAEDRWRARLALAGSYNLVALVDGQPAGMASGVPGDEDGVAELISMWVSPEARGRGVGDRLIETVEGWAKRVSARELRLAVKPDNAAAEALYRRNGFRPTGEVIDGERIMAKPLRA
jgi:ribosomal protein S18 acetylase RimI-like enzyme